MTRSSLGNNQEKDGSNQVNAESYGKSVKGLQTMQRVSSNPVEECSVLAWFVPSYLSAISLHQSVAKNYQISI